MIFYRTWKEEKVVHKKAQRRGRKRILKMDKKRVRKEMNYVLLEKIGKGIVKPIPLQQLEKMVLAWIVGCKRDQRKLITPAERIVERSTHEELERKPLQSCAVIDAR